MNFIKKKIAIFMCMVFMLIPFSSYAVSEGNRSYTVEQARDIFLGELAPKISSQEKAEFTNIVKNWKVYYDLRVKADIGVPSTKESSIMEKLNKTLDQYTEKYLMEEPYEYVEENSSYKNYVVEKLKGTVSASDYERLYKLCERYEDYETSDDELDAIWTEIETILNKYEKLDVAKIMEYILTGSENILAMYDITGDTVSNINIPFVTLDSNDSRVTKTYPKLWKDVTSIIPVKYFTNFDRLIISSDGKYNDLAYVIANDAVASRWNISIDPVDTEEKNLFYETIIHEYFHYMTLNDAQGSYFKKPSVKTYSDYEIVTNENSYLNKFNQKFWGILSEETPYVEDGYLFYLRHKGDFVNEYASTIVSEDICESFAFFVLRDKPKTNSNVDKKLLFFYEYPELVEFRNIVRENIKKIDADFSKAA